MKELQLVRWQKPCCCVVRDIPNQSKLQKCLPSVSLMLAARSSRKMIFESVKIKFPTHFETFVVMQVDF